ncbi:antibiotic acetyltransferase [Vibrio crassostreae 9ZC13]|uniref:CatB-related O-acetyltransferase n=1 Tax=Vibrio crassostreae TaxID=246167 RepID=UPI0002E58A0D|nr:CatB-related O-acetyltransferase [Vibrio crassostreae]OEF01641.1 antibiotic acetyltransferase [Vibrio crassostreae 9ZC13]
MQKKHWSKFELLHEVVTNPNIHVKGQHSYYSDCWDNGFEQSVVRYLHGDEVSRQWEPRWEIDDAYIGKGDTHIEDGVWLGMRAMVMPGVTIGEGAVVAANSVVTKDVAPYSIIGGSPAKVVKYRFDESVIDELMSFKIYEWPSDKFEALKPYLCNSDFSKLKQAITDYDNCL